MPFMYGEEEKAFRRLQEEIIKHTSDLSIFAWVSSTDNTRHIPDGQVYCGILAETPNHFSWCREAQLCIRPLKDGMPVSNDRVRISSRMIVCKRPGGPQNGHYVLPIHHYRSPSRDVGSLGIQLRKVGENQFLRSRPWELFDTSGLHYFDCRGTQQLLLKPPVVYNVEVNYAASSNWIGEDHLWRLRPSTIRFKFDDNVEHGGCYPQARYDNEDELFFVADAYDCNDWGIMNLRASFESNDATRLHPLFVDYTIFTVSWGEDLRPQCSLVSQRTYARQISALQSHMSAHDGDRDKNYLLSLLLNNDIPRVLQSSEDIPGTDATAVMSLRCTKRKSRRDSSILRGGSAWDVHITCTLYERGKVPELQEATKWQVN